MVSKPAKLTADDFPVSPAARREVFERWADQLPKAHASTERPTMVVVAGQPAAGKSRTVLAAHKNLDSAVVIDSDEFRQMHPELAEILRRDPQRMDLLSNGPVGYWIDTALEYCRANRLNAILESTLTRPEQVRDTVDLFRAHGFAATAEVLAVPPAISRLGIVSRYLAGRHSSTRRWTTNNAHQRAVAGLADGMRHLEGVFGSITLRDRSAAELYRGRSAAAAADIIATQYTRALTVEEITHWADDYREACPLMLRPGFITDHTATVSRLITEDAAQLLAPADLPAEHAELVTRLHQHAHGTF